MKKIAIVSLGYFWTPVESGTTRFFQIANTFVNAGYQVEVITTDFQHFDKAPRDTQKIISQNYPFEITFIHTPKYKKNIDVRRITSNIAAAKNVSKYLSSHIKEYSSVYCSIPANNVAAAVTQICHNNNVPCIIDIEDLWPEAMEMVVKNKILRKVLFRPFYNDAEKAYKYASGIIGTSDDYRDRAFKYQKKDIPKDTVYVGCDLEKFDDGVKAFDDKISKPDGEFWVTYAGSISTSYDIKTLIMAADKLYKDGVTDVKVQLLGAGSNKDELESFVKNEMIHNVEFWGFTPYPKMAAVLAKSDVVINSFVKGAPQSIVNKIGDYLASGKAMINTLENPIFCRLVEENRVGMNIEPESVSALVDAIRYLKDDEIIRKQMGANARTLAEAEFDRGTSYMKIIKMVNLVCKKNEAEKANV